MQCKLVGGIAALDGPCFEQPLAQAEHRCGNG
jgi:hypothetical protein